MYNISPLIYPVDGGEYGVYTLPFVESELKKILEASGEEKQYGALFKQRLRYLADRGKNCCLHKEWFEQYKKNDELYAMRIKGKLNLRIFFTFQNNGKPILIHAFLEKNRSDTERAKRIFKERTGNIVSMLIV